MSEQRHIIKRQVIELKIRKSAEARLYQDELSRIYRQRVIPLIEQRCNELGKPDRLYRIESLDLDLGRLDPTDLEEDFPRKVDAALSRELARQIEECEKAAIRSGSRAETASQLELFAFFAQTGSLPWWADASHPGLLEENLAQLLREPPEALRGVMMELVRQTPPRRRLVNHYPDEQLAALCGLLIPAYRQALERDTCELLEALRSLPAEAGDLSRRFRRSLWDNLLLTAGLGGAQYAALRDFYRAALKRTLADLGKAGQDWLAKYHQAIRDGRMTASPGLSDVLAGLAHPAEGEGVETPGNLTPASLAAAWAELKASLPTFPAAQQAELRTLLERLEGGESEQIIAGQVLRLLKNGAGASRVLQMFRSAAGQVALEKTLLEQVRREASGGREAVDLKFSESEALSVGNAGLVILWPFLENFFIRLGLLDKEHRFVDPASRHRAAGLLQVVATGETAPPEYLLPLNKFLCGIDLTDVFDFGPPLLDSEFEECGNLLEAVIAHASILHDMSVDGFRGTFLLRPGLLTARDGMWLLHVERQTYDVVLERFPWSWEWVKLPWMEAPLRVEW